MSLLTKGFTFTAGNSIVASEHNTNFDTLYNAINGALDNSNISASAAIANTKLAAPKSYFTISLSASGAYNAAVDSLRGFQMPFAATLSEVSAIARNIDTSDGDEVYSIDVLEAGSTILSSVINLTTDNLAAVGSISDASIADNAKVTIDLDMGGTSPSLDDLTVLLTFTVSHTT